MLSGIAQKFYRDVNKQGIDYDRRQRSPPSTPLRRKSTSMIGRSGNGRPSQGIDYDRRQRTPPSTPPRRKSTSMIGRSVMGRPSPGFSDEDDEFESRRKPKRFRAGLDDPDEFYSRKRVRVGLDEQPKTKSVRIIRKGSKEASMSIPRRGPFDPPGSLTKRGAFDPPGSRKKQLRKQGNTPKKRLKQKSSSLSSFRGGLNSRIQKKVSGLAPKKLSKKARWMQKRRADTGKPEWLRWDHPPPEYRLKLALRPQLNSVDQDKGGESEKRTAPKEEELWVLEAWTTGVNARETARKRIVTALTKHETDLKVNYVRIAIEVETALFEGLAGKEYTDQLRDVTFNLGSKKNGDFRNRILLEEIDPRSVVKMKAADMASSALRKKRELSRKKAVEERNSEHIMNKALRGESELKAVLGEDAANDKAD